MHTYNAHAILFFCKSKKIKRFQRDYICDVLKCHPPFYFLVLKLCAQLFFKGFILAHQACSEIDQGSGFVSHGLWPRELNLMSI